MNPLPIKVLISVIPNDLTTIMLGKYINTINNRLIPHLGIGSRIMLAGSPVRAKVAPIIRPQIALAASIFDSIVNPMKSPHWDTHEA